MDTSVLLSARSQADIETLKRGLITSGYRDVRAVRSGDDLNALLAAGGKFDVAVLHMEDDYRERLGAAFVPQEILSPLGVHHRLCP